MNLRWLVCACGLWTTAAIAGSGSGSGGTRSKSENLIYAVPMRIAVSSMVANPNITPYDLIDADDATAWNSRTGDLVGAWIAFRVPATVYVEAVTMSAGFNATGPEGDYFTLNHRIKRVAVFHGSTKLREVDLDVDRRDQQTIPVDVTGGDIRIQIVATVPGTKPGWREIAVSELRVVGIVPPDVKRGSAELSVGSLDAAPLPDPTVTLAAITPVPSLAVYCKIYVAQQTAAKCESWEQDCAKTGAAACGATLSGPRLPALPADWKATWFETRKGFHTATRCNLAFTTNSQVYILEDLASETCGAPVSYRIPGKPDGMSRRTISVQPALQGGAPLLVFEKTTFVSDLFDEELVLCAPNASAGVSCTETEIGRIPTVPAAPPEPEHREREWSYAWSIKRGVLTIRADVGKPDGTQVTLAIGPHLLRIAE